MSHSEYEEKAKGFNKEVSRLIKDFINEEKDCNYGDLYDFLEIELIKRYNKKDLAIMLSSLLTLKTHSMEGQQ